MMVEDAGLTARCLVHDPAVHRLRKSIPVVSQSITDRITAAIQNRHYGLPGGT